MKLKHPNSRKQIEVAPEQVPMYASQGWQEVTAAKAAPAARKRAPRKTAAPAKGAAK